MSVEDLEREVMRGLLAGDHPLLASLRKQYAAAIVRDRERTATGFVTRFEVPADVAPIPRKLLHLDDLQVQLEGAATPADTSVHVHNGRLRSLECFVYDGAFPDQPRIQSAWYYGTEKHAGITPQLMALREVDELLEEEE